MFKLSFLLICALTLIATEKIEVDYDSNLDVITLNGKLYIAVEDGIALKSFEAEIPKAETPTKEESKENDCEEALVRGPALIFYLGMVLCKSIIYNSI